MQINFYDTPSMKGIQMLKSIFQSYIFQFLFRKTQLSELFRTNSKLNNVQQRDLFESCFWYVVLRLEAVQTQRSVEEYIGQARSVIPRQWNRTQEESK